MDGWMAQYGSMAGRLLACLRISALLDEVRKHDSTTSSHFFSEGVSVLSYMDMSVSVESTTANSLPTVPLPEPVLKHDERNGGTLNPDEA